MKSPLRIRFSLLILCLVQMLFQKVIAQCPANYAAQTLTYDTTVIGSGNGVYDFTFPQFPSALGTLMSATLKADVSLKYTYSLYNATTSALVKSRMIRTDDIYGSALDPSPISNSYTEAWHNINMPANTLIVDGPIAVNYTQSAVINDGRLFNFMGGGTVSFTYENTSSLSVTAPNLTQIQFVDNSDTTRFSLIYTYCQLIVAQTDLLLLDATRKTASVATLSFRDPSNTTGNTYALEASTDGTTFKTVPASLTIAGSDYTFLYEQAPKDKFYLRIRQITTSGKQMMSDIRTIPAASDATREDVLVYPNPARNRFSYILPATEKGNWKLSVLGTAGNKVFEQQFSNTNTMDAFLSAAVPDGLYFVEAVNLQTGKRHTSKISIRR